MPILGKKQKDGARDGAKAAPRTPKRKEAPEDPNARVKTLSKLTAGLAAVAVASVGFGTYSSITASAEVASVRDTQAATVVAKSDIAQGATITADMVEISDVPSKYRASDAAGATQDVVGKVASTSIASGAQVGTGSLSGSATASSLSSRIASDHVAVTVELSTTSGLAGQLSVGDTVTVISTSEGTSGAAVRTVAEHVKIVSLGGKSADAGSSYSSATVEVDEATAYAIKAAASGNGLDLVLEPHTAESSSNGSGASDDGE